MGVDFLGTGSRTLLDIVVSLTSTFTARMSFTNNIYPVCTLQTSSISICFTRACAFAGGCDTTTLL